MLSALPSHWDTPLFPHSLCSFGDDLLAYPTCTVWLPLLHPSLLKPQRCRYVPAQLRSLGPTHQLQREGSS